MKTHISKLIAFYALFCGACVPSIHPLYTETDLAFDPALIGVWREANETETWDISFVDEKRYRLIHTDESGKKGEFEMRLVKVDGRMFLDLTPVKPTSTQNDFYGGHILTVHTFVHLGRDGATVQISMLDPKWLKSALAQNGNSLRHTMMGDEILITDSSKNLQKFLISNIAVPGAFDSPVTLRRKDGKR
jgi:hypothetical protein